MKPAIPENSARKRLLNAGTDLFSKHGFAGASVRDICALGDTGINMIHHYFGNKQGLYDEILSGFSEDVWTVPARIISHHPRSKDHMVSLLEIFIEETFEALIANHQLFELVVRERMVFETFASYSEKLSAFMKAAQTAGYMRSSADPTMLTGFILDRVGNQVLYAAWIKETTGDNVLTDKAYRQRWLHSNIDLMLNGFIA